MKKKHPGVPIPNAKYFKEKYKDAHMAKHKMQAQVKHKKISCA